LTCKIHTPVTYHEASTHTKTSLIVLQRTYTDKKREKEKLFDILVKVTEAGETDHPLRPPLSKSNLGRGSPFS
jgi:hypothetical protein